MRPRRVIVGLAAALVALVGGVPVPVAAAPAGKPVSAFPAGRWKGVGVITGGIANANASADLTNAGKFTFEVEIDSSGAVIDGTWTLSKTNVNSSVPNGTGTVTIAGKGPLGGTADRVALEGNLTLSGTVTVGPITLDVGKVVGSVPASGGFAPSFATCTSVSGDLATEAQQAQTASGFATSVTGPFTAKLIKKPGQSLSPGFQDTYVNLVNEMEKLSLAPMPPAADVVALVNKVDGFYSQIYTSAGSGCSGGPKNLNVGKLPYSYFVAQFSALLSNALANASKYSASDLQSLLGAAINIGAVGSAAPDQVQSGDLTGAFGDALEQKLQEAKTANDPVECLTVYLTATSGGYTSIAKEAAACAQ